MKVWLDDKDTEDKFIPPIFDVHVKTAQECIELIKTGKVAQVSLDHDLGDENIVGNGYMVASFIEEEAYFGRISKLEWDIHSDNPVGIKRMTIALENADRFWRTHE